jgi:hypothetical protein
MAGFYGNISNQNYECFEVTQDGDEQHHEDISSATTSFKTYCKRVSTRCVGHSAFRPMRLSSFAEAPMNVSVRCRKASWSMLSRPETSCKSIGLAAKANSLRIITVKTYFIELRCIRWPCVPRNEAPFSINRMLRIRAHVPANLCL